MKQGLPGAHNCISTACAVLDVAFRALRIQCAAAGGVLSAEEIEAFYVRFLDSISAGYDLFEFRHQGCMGASLSMAEMPFARDKILATLLRVCGEKSARAAFQLQVNEVGETWIGEFFDGLAQYLCHSTSNTNARLLQAYAAVAATSKTTLTLETLFKQEAVQHVLLECITILEAASRCASMATNICDHVNDLIAGRSNISGAHIRKITEDQTQRFLALCPGEFRITINAAPAAERATAE